jgi:small subunit ribosomal protein S20
MRGMAITSSAKKAHRASLKKHVFNVRRKRALTTAVKETQKLITTSVKDAKASLAKAYQAIDKAAKRGIIKKNTASRKKSRLSAAIKREESK